MRMPSRALALIVSSGITGLTFSWLTACSSFGSDDTANETTDSSDEITALADVVPAEDGGVDASADGAGESAFCETHLHTFCEDFDTTSYPWRFGNIVLDPADGGGSLLAATTGNDPPTRPNALVAHVASGAHDAIVFTTLGLQNSVMHMEFDVRAKATVETQTNFLAINGSSPIFSLSLLNSIVQVVTLDGDGGAIPFATGAGLTDAWVHLRVDYAFGIGQVNVALDGKQLARVTSAAILTSPANVRVELGVDGTGESGLTELLFDNFTVDWE